MTTARRMRIKLIPPAHSPLVYRDCIDKINTPRDPSPRDRHSIAGKEPLLLRRGCSAPVDALIVHAVDVRRFSSISREQLIIGSFKITVNKYM